MAVQEIKTHVDYLLEHVPNLLELSILDLGSGRGRFLIDIAGRGGSAAGLEKNGDYIKETLDKAKQNNLRVKVLRGIAENLPFDDSAFDFVNFALVIEHIEDPNKAIKEMARVMKINAKAYLGAPNRFSFKDPHFHLYFVNWLPRSLCDIFIDLFGKFKERPTKAGRQSLKEMHYFTFGELKKILNENGFEIVDIREKKIRNFFNNKLLNC